MGLKLHVCGARLIGESDGCEPIECSPNDPEASANPILRLSYHGTRRAEWNARMGIVKASPSGWISKIEHLKCRGGMIGLVDAVVERVFPIRYFERTQEGGGRFLSKYEEEISRLSHESRCERIWEKMLMSAETSEQRQMLRENRQLPERNSVMTMTILLSCCHSKIKGTKRRCFLTVWELSEELRNRLREGNRVRVRNLMPTERSLFRGGPLQLQTKSRMTRWIDAGEAGEDCLIRAQYRERQVASSQQIRLFSQGEVGGRTGRDVMLSSLFDMVAMTIRVGEEQNMFVNTEKSISHRQIFVLGYQGEHCFAISFESKKMMEEGGRCRKVSHAILSSPGTLLCFKDLEYVRYDSRYGFHECKISEYTEVSSRGGRGESHLLESHEIMERWMRTNDGKRVVENVSRQVNELLTGSSPKKGALLEEGLLAGISAADLAWSQDDDNDDDI